MDELKVYFNGVMVPGSEARVSVFDHGFLYGDGIFEGIRAYEGRVFKLAEHLDRLYDSAKSILLEIPYTKEELSEAVCATVRANNLQDAYIRLVVSRGKGDLGLDPNKCPVPSVIIIADRIALYPEELYLNGLQLASVSTRRPATDVLNPSIKSLNYLNNILAKIEANLRGLPEVVLLNHQGYVVEGTGDNIFIVKNGELLTPPVYAGILNGITRQCVMELARDMGIPCREQNLTLHDLYNADECFLTGTAAEIVPAVGCDGRVIGDGMVGPITKQTLEAFKRYSRSTGVPVYDKNVATA
ncbi:MAG: branched-chain-amino-acid transaminase [Sulfobacillus thermosulfidooxidans]|uniref:Branched-chain-amino-acid aminotransferase n=1 Tax=Sulfobacillus thermotolerans TaxID=338644 RepID=A0ABM6RRU8_9FIRM|nr:branched-chain-amino-acid transaminase [Sulfobacillus sp. hq2]AUW94202.1 branched-chain-amino-acid transaminase [Sulfobacillus thermotolerans]MCY0907586.1 branched-chain-amino-acid transaminase [Sulfobacillus thermotolerans]POB09530.1 branched-chain-amino-acid transaminase [Sulfobacillus sp. hq2]PSR37360.1 MAG: branched-chain-amino-acid transaminase [Sulfobacillus thermosulfidooxidans]